MVERTSVVQSDLANATDPSSGLTPEADVEFADIPPALRGCPLFTQKRTSAAPVAIRRDNGTRSQIVVFLSCPVA